MPANNSEAPAPAAVPVSEPAPVAAPAEAVELVPIAVVTEVSPLRPLSLYLSLNRAQTVQHTAHSARHH